MKIRTEVGGRGVVAFLEGARPGKTVGLRADFDALPIEDQKDVPYKSTVSGVMHACGHDGHTSTLLHLAKALHEQRDNLAWTGGIYPSVCGRNYTWWCKADDRGWLS